MKSISTGLTLACLLAACACSGDRFEPCDIRQAQCQQDVFLLLQRLRADGWNVFSEMPPVSTITWEQHRDQTLQDASESSDQPNAWDAALRLLNLIAPESSAAEASAEVTIADVVAYYSHASQSVTVIDRGEPQNLEEATEILVHEMVHAIQDREIGLRAPYRTVDDVFARDAYIEGEATLYEKLAVVDMTGISADQVDWDGYYDRFLGSFRERVVESQQPFFSVRQLVYPLGARHLTRLYLRGGNAAIRNAYDSRPRLGMSYMADLKADPPRKLPDSDCDFVEPEGLGIYAVTVFGAPMVYAFLTAAGAGDEAAWRIASAWQDDVILVYSDDNEESVALVWCMSFDDESTAAEVAEVAALIPGDAIRQFSRTGRELVLAAATADEALADWDPGL